MARDAFSDWVTANQQYLTALTDEIKDQLDRHATDGAKPAGKTAPKLLKRITAAREGMPAPAALDVLTERFELTEFERKLLLLCAAVELDGEVAELCARAHGSTNVDFATFGLALAALPDAYWGSLSPQGALRKWLLVDVARDAGITRARLSIDETILHYLTGVICPDPLIPGQLVVEAGTSELVPTHAGIADRICGAWEATAGSVLFPAVQLSGREVAGKRDIAAEVCRRLGLTLYRLPAFALPTAAADFDSLLTRLSRQSTLTRAALLIDADDLREESDPHVLHTVHLLTDRFDGPLFVSTARRHAYRETAVLLIDVDKPTAGEQASIWSQLLPSNGTEAPARVDALVAQFHLSEPMIHAAFAGAVGSDLTADDDGERDALVDAVWRSCREQARSKLDDLAHKIDGRATWKQLVLPDEETGVLREIAAQVRHQTLVYDEWGFRKLSSQGLGVATLFSGSSGTGKTMAAEVLAAELDLDLYRIDLASVVSKYIGETEKNLSRVFDAAEEGGAILLFDEADALFGKRSEVKDSHDRHANIEVSYLLQRMEDYRGLAILTTNQKDALDDAFLRRLRFIVDFPFPDKSSRERLWQVLLPPEAPIDALDFKRLAEFNVAGGNIRNIALGAAFRAADADEPIGMEHVWLAARREFQKTQKPMPHALESEWKGS